MNVPDQPGPLVGAGGPRLVCYRYWELGAGLHGDHPAGVRGSRA